jgi:protocatechuate 3,4-dioxygenase beta subunit
MVLAAVTAVLLLFQTPEIAKASITGVVVRAGTDQPIRGARVTIHLLVDTVASLNGGVASATTDEKGRFAMTGIEPGAYAVKAEQEGYSPQFLGARGPGKAAILEASRGGVLPAEDVVQTLVTLLRLSSGQTQNIMVPLTPAGVITGRVIGREGNPLADVVVKVIPDVYDAGGSRIVSLHEAEASTDDRGEFRFLDAEPGRYFVVAIPPDGFAGYARYTFHPGFREFARALPVVVEEGHEVRLPPLSLQRSPEPRKITGRVIDYRQRISDATLGVALVSRNVGDILEISDVVEAEVDENGRFVAEDVPAGEYWIAAYSEDDAGTAGGIAEIDIGNSDIDGFNITLAPPIVLNGRIRIDGEARLDPAVIEQIRVALEVAELSFAELPEWLAEINEDGTFTIKDVIPLKSRVFALVSGDMYVKDLRFGSTDILGSSLTLTGPTTDSLEVDISTRGGQLRGRVLDLRDRPVRDAQAVLIPLQGAARPDLYKTGYPDEKGQYLLRGIAPGDYVLLAWRKRDRSFFDESYVLPFIQNARVIRIREATIETADVRVIED